MDAIIAAQDVSSIYRIPIAFHEQNLDQLIIDRLQLQERAATVTDLDAWQTVLERIERPTGDEITIAIVGKYVELQDSYKSLNEALVHSAAAANVKLNLRWQEAEELKDDHSTFKLLCSADGILVPGGFGQRGTDGIIRAIQFARDTRIPYLGICYGLQLACIEFARNVCDLANASSTEIDPDTTEPIICKLSDLENVKDMGGTMRRGAYPCRLTPGSLASTLYNSIEISERHRHRYEFNPKYRPQLESAGLRFSGIHEPTNLVEIIELPNHPFFIATQSHPELRSRILQPSKIFNGFIKAALQTHLENPSTIEAKANNALQSSVSAPPTSPTPPPAAL